MYLVHIIDFAIEGMQQELKKSENTEKLLINFYAEILKDGIDNLKGIRQCIPKKLELEDIMLSDVMLEMQLKDLEARLDAQKGTKNEEEKTK